MESEEDVEHMWSQSRSLRWLQGPVPLRTLNLTVEVNLDPPLASRYRRVRIRGCGADLQHLLRAEATQIRSSIDPQN